MIPITIAPTGHATVPVQIDSVGEYNFVLDTGAEGTAVYRKFVDQQGLRASGRSETLVGQSGESELSLVTLPPLHCGWLEANAISAVVLPDRADGVDLAGIIGLDVFGAYLLDFDLPRMRAVLYDSGTSTPETENPCPLQATATTGNLLTVEVQLNGVTAVAVLDTGARKTRINWKLGKNLGLNPETIRSGDTIQGATNTPLATGSAVIDAVMLGSRQILNAPVLVADLPVFKAFGVEANPAVILGMDWLLETRLLVDFPMQKVWFIAAGN